MPFCPDLLDKDGPRFFLVDVAHEEYEIPVGSGKSECINRRRSVTGRDQRFETPNTVVLHLGSLAGAPPYMLRF